MKIFKKLPSDIDFKDFFTKNDEFLWNGDSLDLLNQMPKNKFIDIVVTSPPYNIGKSYESSTSIEEYFFNLGKVFEIIAKCENGLDIDGLLTGPVCHSGFKRLN